MPRLPEKHWVSETKHITDITKEKDLAIPLCIFIDDTLGVVDRWERLFSIPGSSTLRPHFEFDKINSQAYVYDTLNRFMSSVTATQLQRTALLTIDQFYDVESLQNPASNLAARLRELNPEAYILETSGAEDGPIYHVDHASMHFSHVLETFEVLGTYPAVMHIRLGALKKFTNTAFLEAARTDPTRIAKTNLSMNHDFRESTLDSLLRTPEFLVIRQTLLQDGSNNLFMHYRTLTPEDQILFLHHCWMIVGHIREGSPENYYDPILTRLKNLFHPSQNE